MILSVAPLSRIPSETEAVLIREELKAILASESFSSSKRCQDFLQFVVDHTITGDIESLSERFLGVKLFGRAVDYETATDSIVRVRANDVRKRLAVYYGSKGTAAVRIELVAGGYIPEFHWKPEERARLTSPSRPNLPPEAEVVSSVSAELLPALELNGGLPAPADARQAHAKRWLWIAAAAAIAAAIILSVLLWPFKSNFDRFWEPVFRASSPALLSLPATDTFKLTLDATESLGQLRPSESLTLKPNDLIVFHNWHVSLPVVQAALSVAMALDRKGKTPLVRIGTDLRQDEVRGHPVIAIGSFSNPWTEQNVAGLRYTFDRGASDREPPRIRDSQHPERTWTLPQTFPQPQTKDYAIVTRTFDPVTREPFVSLAGLHSFGNQIAGEFVSQDSSWDELAKRAPRGWEKMNFQIVLETNLIGTTPSPPKIVDTYFWK